MSPILAMWVGLTAVASAWSGAPTVDRADAADSDVAPQTVADEGTVEIRDLAGRRVARVVARPGAEVHLPPGRYVIVMPDGSRRELQVEAGTPLAIGPRPPRVVPPGSPLRPSGAAAHVPAPRLDPPSPRAASRRAAWPRRRRWVAPLVGAIVPGAGHLVVRRAPAGVGIFAASLGLGVGAAILGLASDPPSGARADGSSGAREAIRQGSFVLVTDALALLWLAQAADAHRIAANKRVRGRKDHVVTLNFARTSTVGLRASERGIGRYDDYAFGVIGQVAPKWHVGLTDVTLHTARGQQLTLQAGLRAAYRVLTRDRVWLLAALGILIQGTSGPRSNRSIRADAPAPGTAGRFGAVPYVQLETRIFVLSRLSIDVAPRFSVPLGTRYYGRQGALPRYAPTFELAAGAGVYF